MSKPPARLFKKLTAENWRSRDRVSNYIIHVSDDNWAANILEFHLSSKTPKEVQELFEVAQGILCYGCYFYPLFTLGSEQLYRVLEAALHHKLLSLGASGEVGTFADMLKWGKKNNLLTETRAKQWNAARELRNSTSHAVRQSLHDPTAAIRGISVATELINELFDH